MSTTWDGAKPGGARTTAASAPRTRGPLTLGMQRAGKRSAENPRAAVTVAGAGNVGHGGMVPPSRHRKRGTGNPPPAAGAPALDPYGGGLKATMDLTRLPNSEPDFSVRTLHKALCRAPCQQGKRSLDKPSSRWLR